MQWSVFLQDEARPLPGQEIAKLLFELAGGVVLDHVQRLRIHHGWVARGLDESMAGRLVESLGAKGFPAMMKSEDRLVPIDRKIRVHKANLLDDALHLQADLQGNMKSVPWPTLTVVSAGCVKTVKQERVPEAKKKLGLNVPVLLATGIPLPKVKKGKTITVEVEEEKILIHLIFAASGGVIEIRPTEFDYGYLAGRLAPTSQENLLLLVEDLQRLATSAHFTDMTTAFLATGKLEPEFKDDKDFLFFNRWITEKTVP